jgi:hypothetical protein
LDLGNPQNLYFDPLYLAQQRLNDQQRQLERMQNQIAARRQQRAYYDDHLRYGNANALLNFQERCEQYQRRGLLPPRAARINVPRPAVVDLAWQPYPLHQLGRVIPADQIHAQPPNVRIVRHAPARNPAAANPAPQARQPVIYRIPVPGPPPGPAMQNMNMPDALRTLNQRLQNLLQNRGDAYRQAPVRGNADANQRVAEFILQHMPEGGGGEAANPPAPAQPAAPAVQQTRVVAGQQQGMQTASQRVAEFILQHLPNNGGGEATARIPPPPPRANPAIPPPPPVQPAAAVQQPPALNPPASRNRPVDPAEKKFSSLLEYYKGLLLRLIRVRHPSAKELNQYRFLYIGLRKLHARCRIFPQYQEALTRLQGAFQRMTADNARYKTHKEQIKRSLLAKEQVRAVLFEVANNAAERRGEAGPAQRRDAAGPSQRRNDLPAAAPANRTNFSDEDDTSEEATAEMPPVEAPAADNEGGSNSSPESDDYVNNFKFDD